MGQIHINNYPEYLKVLKDYFSGTDKMPSNEDIYVFIEVHNLESDWNVVIEDVKKDITQNILVKRVKRVQSRSKVKKQIIRSYDEYLEKLKDKFGIPESMPKAVDIRGFIYEYDLEKVYGITVEDVEKDLDGFIEGKYDEMYEEALILKQKHVSKRPPSTPSKPISRLITPKPIRNRVSTYNPETYRQYYTPSTIIHQKPSDYSKRPESKKSKKINKPQNNTNQDNISQETYLLDGDNHSDEGVKGIEHTKKDTPVKAFFTQPGAKRKFDKKFAKRSNVTSELVEPGDQAVDKRIIQEAKKITKKKNQKVTIVSQDKGFKKVAGKKKNGSSISTAKSVSEKQKNNRNKKKK